jgi:UDP-N-acetylglucosamine 4,6-dehydratase
VRYGNVVGSRGSVIPLFLKQRETGEITITDPRMTRFWITLDQAARFVISCAEDMQGGEVFVPKIPSMKITDLAAAIAPGATVKNVGIRPGEKLHEALLSEDEAPHTVEQKTRYVIAPNEPSWPMEKLQGTPLPAGFNYASDTNHEWLTKEQINALL